MFRSLALTLALGMVCSVVFSQSNRERREREAQIEKTNEIWSELSSNDDMGKDIDADGESAMILFQERQYHYFRYGDRKSRKEVFRRRIKLLDQAAVTRHSVIYYPIIYHSTLGDHDYRSEKWEVSSGVRLIKPDGRVIDINLPTQSVETAEVPYYWRDDELYGVVEYRKVAIPRLEPGDIIDMFNWSYVIYGSQVDVKIYDPKYVTLVEDYPVKHQQIWLYFDEDHHVSYRSLNGAPGFKEVTNEDDFNRRGERKDGMRRYVLDDRNREDNPSLHYNYTYASFPTVKFQGMYLTGKEEIDPGFIIGEEGTVFSSRPDYEKLQTVVHNRIDDWPSNAPIVKDVRKYIEEVGGRLSDLDKVKLAYEYYQYQKIFRPYLTAGGGLPQLDVDQFQYLAEFSEILTDLELDHNLLITLPQRFGGIAELMLNNELVVALIVERNGERLVLGEPDFYNDWNSFDYSGLGFSAYACKPVDKDGSVREMIVDLQSDVPDDNREYTKLDVEINTEDRSTRINREREFKGVLKYFTSEDLMNPFEVAECIHDRFKEDEDDNPKSGDGYKEEWEKVTERKVKSDIASTYDTLEFVDFEVIHNGKCPEIAPFVIRDEFVSTGAIKTGGDAIWIDLNEIMDGQIRINKDQRELDFKREYMIYMGYPRVYEFEINIKIPDGYTVGNLDNLNAENMGEMVEYTSSASVEDGQISIKYRKAYKIYKCEPDNWPGIVEVLEEAYQFSQNKIILRSVGN